MFSLNPIWLHPSFKERCSSDPNQHYSISVSGHGFSLTPHHNAVLTHWSWMGPEATLFKTAVLISSSLNRLLLLLLEQCSLNKCYCVHLSGQLCQIVVQFDLFSLFSQESRALSLSFSGSHTPKTVQHTHRLQLQLVVYQIQIDGTGNQMVQTVALFYEI